MIVGSPPVWRSRPEQWHRVWKQVLLWASGNLTFKSIPFKTFSYIIVHFEEWPFSLFAGHIDVLLLKSAAIYNTKSLSLHLSASPNLQIPFYRTSWFKTAASKCNQKKSVRKRGTIVLRSATGTGEARAIKQTTSRHLTADVLCCSALCLQFSHNTSLF